MTAIPAHTRTRARTAIGVAVVAAALTSLPPLTPARAADAQRVRFMTVNVDFGSTAAEVKADFGRYAPHADVVMFQEARTSTSTTSSTTVVAASLHMPPGRCATGPGSLYAVMADNVVRLSDAHHHRLLVGGDWNKTVNDDPNDISGRTDRRIVPRGLGIDGFSKPQALTNEPLWRGPDISSPHDPIQMAVSLPPSS